MLSSVSEKMKFGESPSIAGVRGIEEELNITVKEVDMTSNQHSIAEEISPMEMTLEESAKIIVEERRRKLKEFNYKLNPDYLGSILDIV